MAGWRMALLPAILDIYRIATFEKFGIAVDVWMGLDEWTRGARFWLIGLVVKDDTARPWAVQHTFSSKGCDEQLLLSFLFVCLSLYLDIHLFAFVVAFLMNFNFRLIVLYPLNECSISLHIIRCYHLRGSIEYSLNILARNRIWCVPLRGNSNPLVQSIRHKPHR